jgi:hypothetical protein
MKKKINKMMNKIINKVKNLFNEDNRRKIIIILALLIIFWIILYFIPNLFVSLFNTFLGNFILLLATLLLVLYNINYGLIMGLIIIIFYRIIQLSKTKENFSWNKKSENDFILLENSINNHKIFDTNIMKNNTSQEEVDYFNKNGIWPWSENTKKLYKEAINNNPYIRDYDEDSLNTDMTIYNESQILRILSYQSKEGQFLLNGILIKNPCGNKYEKLPNGFGKFPYNSGLKEDKSKDIIKCNMNKENNYFLERIQFTGQEGIYGSQTKKINPIEYNNLENIIPGFKFINEPCNPCVVLNQIPDYSCPFELKLKYQSPNISNIWKSLWNIN